MMTAPTALLGCERARDGEWFHK